MSAAEIGISEEARCRFEEDGYWLGPQLFDAGQREALAYAVDEVNAGRYETGHEPMARFWSPGDDPYALHKVDNSHWCNPVLAEAVRNRQIGRLAAQLLETAAVRLWHEQILMKPAGGRVSANVAWHQDYNYWRSSDRPRMLTAWIPLQEVNPELGTMHFVKGSHRWGWQAAYSHFGRYDMEEQERVIRQYMPEGEKYETAPVYLEAGRVSFHHCLTLHGSGPNLARRQHRRAIAIHIQADECRWCRTGDKADDHKCSQEMERLGKRYGDKFEGDYWPVLWSGA